MKYIPNFITGIRILGSIFLLGIEPFSSLYTYANKVMGAGLFCFPIIYILFGSVISTCLICSIASISAIEELIINIISQDLNRDVKSLFVKKYMM